MLGLALQRAVPGGDPRRDFHVENDRQRGKRQGLTCRATLEFAINVLKVNKVVLCGHTDCGGINTCLALKREALNDGECSHLYQYLQDVDDLYHEHKEEVKAATSDVAQQSRMLSRLNVAKQYQRLLEIDTVQKALARGDIAVYGLLYDVATGRVEKVSS